MKNNLTFGGKVVVLGGDFRQLLPVLEHSTRSEKVSLSIKYSSLWPHFKIYKLTQNMRALENEEEFSNFLLDIGDGKINDKNDTVKIPQNCIANGLANIATDIYKKLIEEKRFRSAAKYAILSARNVDVDMINKSVVEMLDVKTEKIYSSVDSTDNCNGNGAINSIVMPEILNSLCPKGFPPHELRLRQFSVIMLIRNLNINDGLCNGTRLLILELQNNLLKCEILTGDKVGQIVFLNRIIFMSDNDYLFSFQRRQFPIKIAFAMTINKAQGQTFEQIGIDLQKDVFNHGQLYVALSRVRSWSSLKIYRGNHIDSNIVKNYVYTELFT